MAAAAKGLQQAAVPHQKVRMPSCKGRQQANDAGLLQRGNAVAHYLAGETKPVPHARCVQCHPAGRDDFSEQIRRTRYVTTEPAQALQRHSGSAGDMAQRTGHLHTIKNN